MTNSGFNGMAVARVGVLALMWGSTYLWIELALTWLSPHQVTFARSLLGAAVLIVLCLSGRRGLPRDRTTWLHVLVAALLCNALPYALFSLGQQSLDSGVAGVLNATTPLWTLLFGVVIGSERRPHPIRLGGLLLGFAGVLLIFAPWHDASLVGWGAAAILGAAASYAVAFIYMGRKLVGRGHATVSLSASQLVAATGLTALALPIGGPLTVPIAPVALVAVVVLGVVCTAFTFHLTYRLIADEGATNAATVGYLLPVVSVLLGAIFLHEALSPRIVAGMTVVLLGVGMSRWRPKPAPRRVSPADLVPSGTVAAQVDRPAPVTVAQTPCSRS